ncbi:MAG: hypothetical protein CMQ38_06135 [Gammaproteobacteria bacterium]|nr:hypothetical protein [Gammaproteobacteria bacterium]
MRLVKLSLRNFRCYGPQIDLNISDLTSIIGKNDVGKSAILEALDAFLMTILIGKTFA